ncbi:MAG: PilZ domain-containing protein [Calditrichaeota bacterium]|nr:MAG: PilZ domain-containing protein [Calditrichota bacterium]
MQETRAAEQIGFVDKRNSQRFECWSSLQFHHNTAWERGIATDISDTGIHIVTLHPLEEGSKVKVCFDEPGTFGSRTLVGKVRWKSELSPFESKNWIAPSMGIEFTSKLPVDASAFAKQNKPQ